MKNIGFRRRVNVVLAHEIHLESPHDYYLLVNNDASAGLRIPERITTLIYCEFQDNFRYLLCDDRHVMPGSNLLASRRTKTFSNVPNAGFLTRRLGLFYGTTARQAAVVARNVFRMDILIILVIVIIPNLTVIQLGRFADALRIQWHLTS